MYKNIAVLALLALSPLTSCSDEAPTQDSTSIYAAEIKPSRAWVEPIIKTIQKEMVTITNADGNEIEVANLVIEIFEEGTGTVATKYDRVHTHYQGWVRNTENIFDSSYERGGPLSFYLGNGKVIKGWDLGFEGMAVGTRARFTINTKLGYANRPPTPAIPKNADLVFDVELVKIGK